MTQQYGTVKVDVITYTSGTGGSETDQSITVSSLATISRTGIAITGDISANNIYISGVAEVSGLATVSGLVVGQDATITGNLVVGSGLQASSLVVQDDATVSGALGVSGLATVSGLTVNNDTSLNNLTATGATTLNTLTATGDTSLNTLTATGATNLNTLTATGDSNFEDVAVSGNLTVTGNATISGNLTVSGDFNASGITISGFTGLFASGTETEPSISFAADPNTGLYNKSGDSIAITANGSDKVEITSDRVSFFQGASATPFAFNVAAGTLIGNDNTANLPPVASGNQGGAYFSWNKSQGNAEVNIYNPYVGTDGLGAGVSFLFEQMTSGTGGYNSTPILELSQGQTQTYVSGVRLSFLNQDGLAVGNLSSTGVANPYADLDIQSNNPTLRFTDKNQNAYSRIVYDANLSTLFVESDKGNDEANSKIQFSNDDTAQAFLATSGEFLLKDTYTIRKDFYNKTFGARFQIEGGDHNLSSIGIARNSENGGAGWLQFGKSRGTADGDVVIVQSGDTLGGITFGGADGYGFLQGVNVYGRVSDTPASGNIPAELIIQTFVSGTPNNNVTINSGGVTIDSKEVVTEADIGTGPNQIPMNWMLGKDAYSSSKSVEEGYTFLRLGAVTPGSQYVRPLGTSRIFCNYSVNQGRCFVDIRSNAAITATDKNDYLALEGANENDIIVVAGLPLLTYQRNLGTTHRGQIDYTYLNMLFSGWDPGTNSVIFEDDYNLGNTGTAVDSDGTPRYINTKFVPVQGPTYGQGLPPPINTAALNENFRNPINTNNQTAYNGWNSYFFIKPVASAGGSTTLAELRIRDLWGLNLTGDTRIFDARLVGSYIIE